MLIRIVDPNHCLFGSVVEATRKVHNFGSKPETEVVDFSFIGIRPFDPDVPRGEDYRRFYQILSAEKVEVVHG